MTENLIKKTLFTSLPGEVWDFLIYRLIKYRSRGYSLDVYQV